MSEQWAGAASGAAQGFSVGGPPGAIIGFGLGAIAGEKADKAKKALDTANRITNRAGWMRVAIQRRDMVREMLFKRGMQLAAGATDEGADESSTYLGAKSSTMSQFKSNISFFDKQVRMAKQAESFYNKAGAAGAAAQNIYGLLNLVPLGMAAGKGIGNYFASLGPSGSSGTGTSTFSVGNTKYDMGE